MSDQRRFEAFTREEIQALWEALLFDGGIRYDPEPDSVEARLVAELERESRILRPHDD